MIIYVIVFAIILIIFLLIFNKKQVETVEIPSPKKKKPIKLKKNHVIVLKHGGKYLSQDDFYDVISDDIFKWFTSYVIFSDKKTYFEVLDVHYDNSYIVKPSASRALNRLSPKEGRLRLKYTKFGWILMIEKCGVDKKERDSTFGEVIDYEPIDSRYIDKNLNLTTDKTKSIILDVLFE